MKKRARVLTSLALLFSSSLCAEDSVKPNGCDGAVLCPTFPVAGKADCCRRWHVDIGLLYQQPSCNNMVAGVSYSPSIAVTDPYQDREIEELFVCFDYALGLTVSLGHMIDHDSWYFGARFDYLESNTNSVIDVSDEPNIEVGINPLFDTLVYTGTGLTSVPYSKVIYSGKMDVYVLDVLLSRGSYHSRYFSYEPYVGVKALWFNTKIYTTNFSPSFTSGNFSTYLEKQKNWGAGPMFGFNSQYYFFNDLAFFSDCDIAVLYGSDRFRSTSTLAGVLGAAVDTDQKAVITENLDCELYIPIRTILGLAITKYCFEDRHYLALKIGYDLRAVLSYPEVDAGFTMSGLYTNFIWNF